MKIAAFMAALSAFGCFALVAGTTVPAGHRQVLPAVLPVATPEQVAAHRASKGEPLTKAEKDALDELLQLIQQGIQSLLEAISADLDETLATITDLVNLINQMQEQGLDWEQFLWDFLAQVGNDLLNQLGDLIGFPILKQADWDLVTEILDLTVEVLLDVYNGDIELAIAAVEALMADILLLEEQGVEAWQQELLDLALANLESFLADLQSMIEGNPKLRALLNNRDALDDLLALIQQGLDGILELVDGNLEAALTMVQDMVDMLHELQAQSSEDWTQQLIDMALQSLGTMLGQLEDMLGISPFKSGKVTRQVYKVTGRNQVQKLGNVRGPLEDLLALIEQGLDGIIESVEGNLEEALIYVQNMIDMLHELQAQSPEDWEQQLIDMALQSLGTMLGQLEDMLGITPRDLKNKAVPRGPLEDLLALIEQGLDGIIESVEGNLEEALIYVQNMIDMLHELQAQSPEDWEQQLIDMALQSLGTMLGQLEDMLGITPFGLKRKALPRGPLEDLLALIEQGLDGIIESVEGNLEEALIYVQNMIDMLHELQAQSPEDWEQQLIDMALQSLGTMLGQLEDMLGITPFDLKRKTLPRGPLEDLLALIEQGLDGIIESVEGNLEEALIYVQNMIDMLHELQAQSPEDWEQQLIDMALQSLGTMLGQLEDMLGITPFSLKGKTLPRGPLEDLLSLIEQGLDGIIESVEGNLEEALIYVQNMIDMLHELQAQSPEDWEQQLIDMALQSLGTMLGQLEDMLGITP